jgi:predicted TIM-barrel fold metal-dependent hydrolase
MIDVNAYIGPFAFRRLRNNTPAGLLALMDRAGIAQALVSSAAAITYRNAHAGNEELAAAVRGYQGRLIPCAVLNPAYAGWRHDLKICAGQFGMRAVRLYPRWHNYRLTDPECLELVSAAAELRMAVSIPYRAEDRRQQSWLVDVPDVNHDEVASLVAATPQARFILGNGNGFAGSVLGRRARELPANYAVEMSLLTAELANEAGQLLKLLGEDRLLFGTGIPFHYPEGALAKLHLLDLPRAVHGKVVSGNARRWLGL